MSTDTVVLNAYDILTGFMNADEVINCYVRQSSAHLGGLDMDRDCFFQMEIENVIVDALIFTHSEALAMRSRLIERNVYAPHHIRIRPYTYAPTNNGNGTPGAWELLDCETVA